MREISIVVLIVALLSPALGVFGIPHGLDGTSCPVEAAAILPCSGSAISLIVLILFAIFLTTAVFSDYRARHALLFSLFLSGLLSQSSFREWLARFQLSPSTA